MSGGVMAYAVDDLVWDTIGDGREETLELSEMRSDGLVASLDEILADLADRERPLPTARQALRHMIMGEPYDPRIGFVYGRWLAHLCNSYGRFLPNEAWMPAGTDFIETVQQSFARAGVTDLSLRDMFFGGPPIPLPAVADFPGIGFTSRGDVPGLLATVTGGDLDSEQDMLLWEAMDQVRHWLTVCAEGNQDLVCFYG